MPLRNEPNDIKSPNTSHRSLLVTLSARAIGSLGFGLSILAIGFRWIVPLATAFATGAADKPKQRGHRRSRRRLALGAPAPPAVQQATPSIRVNNQNTSNNSYREKHVYFSDKQCNPNTTSELVTTLHDSLTEPSSPEETPQSSIPPLTDSSTVKRDDDSVAESDSSSRRSSLSLYLPKRILPFGSKSRQSIEPSPAPKRSSSLHESKQSRRSSKGFIPPWSPRRKSLDTPTDFNDEISSRPTPLKPAGFLSGSSDSIQVSYLPLKKTNNRRTSAPTTRTRTQPYDAPYFALPPTGVTFDLRKSPPMLQEALINSTMQHASEDNRGRPLQLGRQSLTKRRSASEGWNNGRRVAKIIF